MTWRTSRAGSTFRSICLFLPERTHQQPEGSQWGWALTLLTTVTNYMGVLQNTKSYAPPGRWGGSPWFSLQRNWRRTLKIPRELLHCQAGRRVGGGFDKTSFCLTCLRQPSSQATSRSCFPMRKVFTIKANVPLSCPLLLSDSLFITTSSHENAHQHIKAKPSTQPSKLCIERVMMSLLSLSIPFLGL